MGAEGVGSNCFLLCSEAQDAVTCVYTIEVTVIISVQYN